MCAHVRETDHPIYYKKYIAIQMTKSSKDRGQISRTKGYRPFVLMSKITYSLDFVDTGLTGYKIALCFPVGYPDLLQNCVIKWINKPMGIYKQAHASVILPMSGADQLDNHIERHGHQA